MERREAAVQREGYHSLYRRPNRLWRLGALALGAGAIAGVACGGWDKAPAQGITADQWVQTDGAAGRINLDDVHDAYRESFDKDGFQVSKFEKRVNEIYEGDHLVLIQVDRQGDQVVVSGWEDLNDNKVLDPTTDDKLFSIAQKLENNGKYEVRGHGANGYYTRSGSFDGFFAGLFLGNLLSGGRTTYTTPPGVYDAIGTHRSSYRLGPDYQRQQQRNATYGGSISSRFGSAATAQPVSPARSSYQSRQINSGGFRASSSTSRSIGSGSKSTSSAAKGGGSSDGGLSGGGGMVRL